MSTPTEEYQVTKKEAGEILNICLSGLNYHMHIGNLGYIKRGHRVYFNRKDVEALRDQHSTRKKGKTLDIKFDERNRQDDLKFTDVDNRLSFLETVMGVSGRSSGLTKAALLALTEEVVTKNRQVEHITDKERDTWVRRISAMDYKTIKYCLKNPELANMPIWLLRLGIKIANHCKLKKDRDEILIHCRNLRLLLQSFSPPRPVYYSTFPLLAHISPIDSLIIASHAAH